MAGSKRWFRYTTDEGSVYALNIDESNTELVNTVAEAQAIIVAGTRPLPRGINARFVMLSSDDNLVKRKCFILSPEQFQSLAVGQAYTLTAAGNFGVSANTPVLIRLKNPELMRRQPFPGDTSQLDGDNP
jgi:hypothetical protein